MNKLMYRFVATRKKKKNKMPAALALRVMLGLIHLFQLYALPIDKTILASGYFESRRSRYVVSFVLHDSKYHRKF